MPSVRERVRSRSLIWLRITVWNKRPPAIPVRRRQLRAARTLSWFVLIAFSANVAVFSLLNQLSPGARDPEYGRRIQRIRARIAEHPGRPSVVCLGSSRTAMGICPAAWEASRANDTGAAEPLLLNLGLQGSGPIMELMALRRLFADGMTQHAILLEYWPPFLDGDPTWAETMRIAPHRLAAIDRPLVRSYFPDAEHVEREMDRYRRSPIYANRECLLGQVMPTWLRRERRTDDAWSGLDPWGWLPGAVEPVPAACESCRQTYEPLLANYQLSLESNRAIMELVETAREHGVKIGLIYLPESSQLRTWYSPRAEQEATDHLAQLGRVLGVPIINARTWMDDASFVDGIHLTRGGAAAFTRKLGPVIRAMFGCGER